MSDSNSDDHLHRSGPEQDGTPAGAEPPASHVPPADVPPADAPPADTPPADTPGADADPVDAESEHPAASGFAGYRARRRARKQAKAKRKAPWWELPALIVLAVVIAILVKSFVIQPFYIPSQSMENTLHGSDAKGHDRILVFKPIYDFRDPEPGDIVVFDLPGLWNSSEGITTPPGNPIVRVVRGFGQLIGFVPPDGQVLVKRVIATGGQTVKGDAAGHVMISTHGANGPYRTLDERSYVLDDPGSTQQAFGPVTVPRGRLWVMGDHRNMSADSRFHCVRNTEENQQEAGEACDPVASTVPVGDVIGKAVVVAWPPSHWRTLGTPTTFENASALASPALPSVVGTAVVVPIFLVRRRRRR